MIGWLKKLFFPSKVNDQITDSVTQATKPEKTQISDSVTQVPNTMSARRPRSPRTTPAKPSKPRSKKS